MAAALGVSPLPLAMIACGLPLPSLCTVIVALRKPTAAGVNVTLKLHAAPALSVAHVEPLTANSLALLLAIDDTFTAALPTFASVTDCGALLAPVLVSGIVTLAGTDSCPIGGGGG